MLQESIRQEKILFVSYALFQKMISGAFICFELLSIKQCAEKFYDFSMDTVDPVSNLIILPKAKLNRLTVCDVLVIFKLSIGDAMKKIDAGD